MDSISWFILEGIPYHNDGGCTIAIEKTQSHITAEFEEPAVRYALVADGCQYLLGDTDAFVFVAEYVGLEISLAEETEGDAKALVADVIARREAEGIVGGATGQQKHVVAIKLDRRWYRICSRGRGSIPRRRNRGGMQIGWKVRRRHSTTAVVV